MTGLAVPAYFHPAVAGHAWQRMAGVPEITVVANMDSGPGPRRDPEYVEVLTPLLLAGASVLGYVNTDYGARPMVDVLRDVDRYQRFYRISAIFLDQVRSDVDGLTYCRGLTRAVRAAGVSTVVFNPGVQPHAEYFDLADAVNTFEGPWSRYRNATWPVHCSAPRRCWNLIYNTPADDMGCAMELAERRGATSVYITDRWGANPWNGLPTYFDEQRQLLGLAALA
jgi:hypothetical protein